MQTTLKFTLPDMYDLFVLNQSLMEFSQKMPEAFKVPVRFTTANGMYPFCIAAGNKNKNFTHIHANYATVTDIASTHMSNGAIIELDCSNYFLTEQEIENNSYLSFILSLHDRGDTIVEISNIELIPAFDANYIIDGFSFGANNDFHNEPDDITTMNSILDNPRIKKLKYPVSLNTNMNVLKLLTHRDKIEITVNPCCPYECEHRFSCHAKENMAIREFSETSIFATCSNTLPLLANPQCLDLNTLQERYVPMGITRFAFDSWGGNVSAHRMQVKDFYIHYFIKPEYHELAGGNIYVE